MKVLHSFWSPSSSAFWEVNNHVIENVYYLLSNIENWGQILVFTTFNNVKQFGDSAKKTKMNHLSCHVIIICFRCRESPKSFLSSKEQDFTGQRDTVNLLQFKVPPQKRSGSRLPWRWESYKQFQARDLYRGWFLQAVVEVTGQSEKLMLVFPLWLGPEDRERMTVAKLDSPLTFPSLNYRSNSGTMNTEGQQRSVGEPFRNVGIHPPCRSADVFRLKMLPLLSGFLPGQYHFSAQQRKFKPLLLGGRKTWQHPSYSVLLQMCLTLAVYFRSLI